MYSQKTENDVVRAGEEPQGPDPRALNALTHGLTARRVLEHEKDKYEGNLRALVPDTSGVGPVELALLRRTALLCVRLDRAGTLESVGYANCFEDREDGSCRFNQIAFSRLLDTVHRYELAVGRTLCKTQHELERLSETRRGGSPSPTVCVDFNW